MRRWCSRTSSVTTARMVATPGAQPPLRRRAARRRGLATAVHAAQSRLPNEAGPAPLLTASCWLMQSGVRRSAPRGHYCVQKFLAQRFDFPEWGPASLCERFVPTCDRADLQRFAALSSRARAIGGSASVTAARRFVTFAPRVGHHLGMSPERPAPLMSRSTRLRPTKTPDTDQDHQFGLGVDIVELDVARVQRGEIVVEVASLGVRVCPRIRAHLAVQHLTLGLGRAPAGHDQPARGVHGPLDPQCQDASTVRAADQQGTLRGARCRAGDWRRWCGDRAVAVRPPRPRCLGRRACRARHRWPVADGQAPPQPHGLPRTADRRRTYFKTGPSLRVERAPRPARPEPPKRSFPREEKPHTTGHRSRRQAITTVHPGLAAP